MDPFHTHVLSARSLQTNRVRPRAPIPNHVPCGRAARGRCRLGRLGVCGMLIALLIPFSYANAETRPAARPAPTSKADPTVYTTAPSANTVAPDPAPNSVQDESAGITTTAETDNTAGAAPQSSETPDAAVPAATPAAPAPSLPQSGDARFQSIQDRYGLWVLAPPLVAILLAIFFRQVVPALVIGILTGAYMLTLGGFAQAPYAPMHPAVGGFRLAAEGLVLNAITPADGDIVHTQIILFTLIIGFMVGVLGRNGGTAGMVDVVAGRSHSVRRGRLTAWLAGMIVFFDDYANTMIIGPTMKSVFDKLRISRAKLAYIVDSTAAPVASLALVGTWVGFEITQIDGGLQSLPDKPAFLSGATGMSVFIQSLLYRHYAILALVFVFFICALGRDFGPMKRSESRALSDAGKGAALDVNVVYEHRPAKPRWWLGMLPVLVLIGATIGLLVWTGMDAVARKNAQSSPAAVQAAADTGVAETTADATGTAETGGSGDSTAVPAGSSAAADDAPPSQADDASAKDGPFRWMTDWRSIEAIISAGDSYIAIFYGAILSAIVALILTAFARACPIRDAADAGLEGMARMMPAIVILVLAWALSDICQRLELGQAVAASLKDPANPGMFRFPLEWAPLAIFASAAFISFATGTAWGTMGILCPIVVRVMGGAMAGAADASIGEDATLFYAAVGAVLAGAVFGDHCSPISDTTVLSSVATGCRHEEHVWTQIPYAFVTALVAAGCGNIVCDVYNQPWYIGLSAGAVVLLLFLLIVGRRPKPLTTDTTPVIPSSSPYPPPTGHKTG